MSDKIVEISLKTEYITLGQLLKLSNVVSTGGEVKSFLLNNVILVNNEKENRRGKKLYKNDLISVSNKLIKLK